MTSIAPEARLQIPAAVAPFARRIDAPWIKLEQDSFNTLQQVFGATDHTDFSAESYASHRPNDGSNYKLLHLPFRLALGLHPSVGPKLDIPSTKFVLSAYLGEEPLFIREDGMNTWQRDTMRRMLCGSVIEAAMSDPDIPYRNIPKIPDSLRSARLLSKSNAARLKYAVDLVV